MNKEEHIKAEDSTIAFALGGLAGNNAHGAGFLQAALERRVVPAMISCTSGQIYWTYKYLQALNGKSGVDLRGVLETKIREMKPFKNPDLDMFWLWLNGIPGVCRPAFLQWNQDLASNSVEFIFRRLTSFRTVSFVESFLEIFPNHLYDPAYAEEFGAIAGEFNDSQIGIIFNAYNPYEGREYIYLNDAARRWLARWKKDRIPRYESRKDKDAGGGYRKGSYYQDITDEAIKNGLRLYEYGFDGKKDVYLDGAYFRQIMLSELSYATDIYVVRPISARWIGKNLPMSYIGKEDLKTEVGFNGSYAAEKHRINLINKLLNDGELNRNKYHEITLHDVDLDVQRGFFDYIYESLEVFDDARTKSLNRLDETRSMIIEHTASVRERLAA